MDVQARPAETHDLPELTRLAREAIDERRGARGGDLWILTESRAEPVGESLAAALEAPGTTVLVGTIDDVPVGYAVLRIDSLRDGSRLGTITELYTSPGARGVAVGEAMMGEVMGRADTAGCIGVETTVLPGDRATKNFFEAHGLVARALIVHRSLESR